MGTFPYLEVDVTTFNITKSASTDVISFKSNRSVKASMGGCLWIRASVDGEQIVLDWDENDYESTRQAVLTVSTSNNLFKKEITIIQDASGELTIQGDLILRSKEEIANNTYTKVLGNLIIGNVTSIMSKASDGDVITEMGDRIVIASPSDIDDSDIALLNEQINLIGEKGIAIINTNAESIPVDFVKSVGVKNLYLDNNQISELPDADVMASLGLKELSLAGNEISDVSALAECNTIEYLDISGNDVYDLEPLMEMEALETVVLTDLPLTQVQVDVFREQTGMEVVAESVRQDESPLPVFGALEITEVSDTEVIIKAKIENNAADVTKAGFYIGTSRALATMTWHDAVCIDGTLTFTYHPETLQNQVYFVRAYAENSRGGNYSKAGYFGSMYFYGDMFINSEKDVHSLIENRYSHIEGSLLIGERATSGPGMWLDDGRFYYCFKPLTFSDLSALQQIAYVRDGLYIGNVGLGNANMISHIAGMKTLWLRGNGIKNLPEMECDESLTYLDISMNSITDFSFLERMPALEKLYLGSSDFPVDETNSIGVLTGLEKYTNLKYIDLSGLPIHEWQAKDLRVKMPGTEIVFSAGSQVPYIPTVVSLGVVPSDNKAVISGYIESAGASSITEYGFYFGKDKKSLEKIVVGSEIEDGCEFSYEVEIPDYETYYYYPYAINYYGESRVEVKNFDLNVGDLSRYGTANCYIVSAPGEYFFNATVKGNSTEAVGGQSVTVVWETKNTREHVSTGEIVRDVTYSEPYIHFSVPEPFTPGNALIAIKNVHGTIVWSWHIWVTDYNPDLTAQKYISGAVMMDRNLGALDAGVGPTAYGFLYQWGRKDPLIGSGDGSEYFANTAPESVKGRASSDDPHGSSIWFPQHVVVDLFNTNDSWGPEKTKFDPCPVGWRVPDGGPGGAWDGIEWGEPGIEGNNNAGYWIINPPYSTPAAKYPAPGYTDGGNYDYWDPIFPGSALYCWSNTYIDNHNAYGMHLFNRIETQLSASKDSEFSVRCQRIPADFSVETTRIVSETESSIVVEGKLTAEDDCTIIEKGFLVSVENAYPSIYSNLVKVTHSDTETGSFECTFNKPAAFKFYVCAYAISDNDVKYGDVITCVVDTEGNGEGFTGDDFEF